jgi:NAD(P)-dependent dehydrogenase (short-subunit alcohol dehydrogenase family)
MPNGCTGCEDLMAGFTGKVAIVTGGGSGIGKATAQRFAAEGAQVVVADINPAAATEVAEGIKHRGEKGIAAACDISQDFQVQSLMSTAMQSFGRIDILVNCAARFLMKGGREALQDDWREIFGTNVGGTALCCRYAAERMKETGGGAIVVVSSISGMIADADYATYSTSKAALLMLARSLAIDFGPWNIRVNAISPGAVNTPSLKKQLERENLSREQFEAIVYSRQCLKMLIEPDDIARPILFLTGDDAKAVTGANLVVDAGFTTGR